MYKNARSLADRVNSELGIQIAPVGEAWWAYQNSTQEKADTRDLYTDDGVHATPLGTYLTACVFYAVLFDKDPEGLPTLSFEQAERMQKIAGEVVRNF
jgi:hypothetical protein